MSHSIGNYFVSRRYRASEKLLQIKGKIEPKDIKVDEFRSDYLRMYEEWEEINPHTIFTGVPFTGIPWMEAILGCDIFSTGFSFIAKNLQEDIESIDIEKLFNKDWFELYISFTKMLNELGKNRFPAGQPIMRGPTDIAGTILGQDKMIFYFFDCPQKIVRLLNDFTDTFLYVINNQKKYIDSFDGGYSIGFYDLWCPGDCIWFQDDLTALLSPDIYKEYIFDIHKKICKSYKYSLVHLHPASFFILDQLLEIEELKAVEINKDVGGPKFEEMIPQLKKVQTLKNLVIWGDFNREEFNIIKSRLIPQGLYVYNFNEQFSKLELNIY